VLNTGGRPLEFHCTAPVKASRAQEILYGPTLRPYLCGEQIGFALVSKAKSDVLLVFTDDASAAGVRDFSSSPVVLVSTQDVAHSLSNALSFKLGSHNVALETRHSSDEPLILSRWKEHGHSLDLVEPFGRIREALEEAQKTARAAA